MLIYLVLAGCQATPAVLLHDEYLDHREASIYWKNVAATDAARTR